VSNYKASSAWYFCILSLNAEEKSNFLPTEAGKSGSLRQDVKLSTANVSDSRTVFAKGTTSTANVSDSRTVCAKGTKHYIILKLKIPPSMLIIILKH
jgi:hypothetical protein